MKARRESLGLSRMKVAVAIGRHQNTVYQWEQSAAAPPNADDLAKLARVLDTPIDSFFVQAVDASCQHESDSDDEQPRRKAEPAPSTEAA